jgi:hypothetical protein
MASTGVEQPLWVLAHPRNHPGKDVDDTKLGLRIQIKIMTTGTSGIAQGIIRIPRATGRSRNTG